MFFPDESSHGRIHHHETLPPFREYVSVFSNHRRSKATTLPPTTMVLVGKWYVSKMSFRGKFSTEPYRTGRKDKKSRIELVGVPYVVSKKNHVESC